MSEKRYSSTHKLNTLPVGSRVSFGDVYSPTWVKGETGWRLIGSSWPIPFDAKTVLAYSGNRSYTVALAGGQAQ
jgi:hypothetical protein